MARVLPVDVDVGVRRVDDLIAFQWAVEFKREVYRLLSESPEAKRDFRFRDQLIDAAAGVEANIAEGFARFRPKECQAFLRYAIASLAESRVRLTDGIDRGYFAPESISDAGKGKGKREEGRGQKGRQHFR